MEEVFGSALVSQDEKMGVLDRVLGSRVSTTTMSFLKVLTQHDRLGVLRQVVRMADQLWEERVGLRFGCLAAKGNREFVTRFARHRACRYHKNQSEFDCRVRSSRG